MHEFLVIFGNHLCPGVTWYLRWLMLITLWMLPAALSCPVACKCSIKSGSIKTEVNCQKRGLPVFPSNLPTDAWILKLGEYVVHDDLP